MERTAEEYRRVGIFEGAFSPIHNGHVKAAKAFMEQMRLDYLFVIPHLTCPEKNQGDLAPLLDRLKMCELAFEGVDGVIVSDLSKRMGGSHETVDILRMLRADDVRLFLLCGTDTIMSMDKRKNAEEIFGLCWPVYVRREQDPLLDGQIIKKLKEYYDRFGKMVRKIQMEPVTVSSTSVRRAVREKSDLKNLVPDSVAAYIHDQHLYG